MSFIGHPARSFQFWSNTKMRPKRNFEGILIFPDLIYGGDGLNNLEPFLVKSFSRPGYNQIETQTSEYQLRSGDFAKIDYPTQKFSTKPLKVKLIDMSTGNKRGPDTAAAIHGSLVLQQKTATFEHEAGAHQPGSTKDSKYLQMVEACREYPSIFFIIEMNGAGEELGTWEIWNPVLTAVNFSDINYEGASFATIDLSFQYSNFKLNHGWGQRILKNKLKQIKQGRKTPIADALREGADWWTNTATTPWH